jgi:hypothetical protein
VGNGNTVFCLIWTGLDGTSSEPHEEFSLYTLPTCCLVSVEILAAMSQNCDDLSPYWFCLQNELSGEREVTHRFQLECVYNTFAHISLIMLEHVIQTNVSHRSIM